MIVLLWTSVLIFFVSFGYFCSQTVRGKWTVRTKWSELSREQWITFAGMAQVVLPLITLQLLICCRASQ